MELISVFYIEIELTSKGLANWEKVVNFVFHYIQMLKKKGVQKWIFDEIKIMNQLKFDNKNKEEPDDYVDEIVSTMPYYPIQDILRLDFLMEKF